MSSTNLSASRQGRQKLASFLTSLSNLAGKPLSDEIHFIHHATILLKELVDNDDWLEERFARPHPDYYQQYLLYCDPERRFSVVSFVWGPGQQTPIHDHTVWGLIGMLRGSEISETFEILDGKPVSHGEERLDPGDIATVSPSIGDIHRVRNAFNDRVSISIHVYGADIGAVERHVYSPEGGATPFVSGYSNRFLPNIWGLA